MQQNEYCGRKTSSCCDELSVLHELPSYVPEIFEQMISDSVEYLHKENNVKGFDMVFHVLVLQLSRQYFSSRLLPVGCRSILHYYRT